MAAICIGGVCVPYTAVLPLLALALKWMAERLAGLGLLPEFAAKRLGFRTDGGGPTEGRGSRASDRAGGGGASGPTAKIGPSEAAAAGVRDIETAEDWNAELSSSHAERPVVAKFTASWCKPCEAIDPFYRDLAARYDAAFVKVDVDELDEVAADCSVAMMPTFVVFSGKERKGSVSGANEDKLERLIKEHCARRVRT